MHGQVHARARAALERYTANVIAELRERSTEGEAGGLRAVDWSAVAKFVDMGRALDRCVLGPNLASCLALDMAVMRAWSDDAWWALGGCCTSSNTPFSFLPFPHFSLHRVFPQQRMAGSVWAGAQSPLAPTGAAGHRPSTSGTGPRGGTTPLQHPASGAATGMANSGSASLLQSVRVSAGGTSPAPPAAQQQQQDGGARGGVGLAPKARDRRGGGGGDQRGLREPLLSGSAHSHDHELEHGGEGPSGSGSEDEGGPRVSQDGAAGGSRALGQQASISSSSKKKAKRGGGKGSGAAAPHTSAVKGPFTRSRSIAIDLQ